MNGEINEMFKKILLAFVILTVALTSNISYVSANAKTEIKIVHNNVEQKQAVQPEMKNNTVYVPVRAIFDALQIEYTFDPKTKKVSAQQGDKSIELVLNSKDAVVNGKPYTLNDAVYTVKNYTFVPLRLIGETFGANISWDAKTQSVIIVTEDQPLTTPTPLEIKDEAEFNELKKLTDKYPDYASYHLFYIILEKKDVSWLPYYLELASKSDIQDALEASIDSGYLDAVDYILTHYKSSIENTVGPYENSSLFILTYPINLFNRYVKLEPEKQRVEYKVLKTEEEAFQMIELLTKHGLKPSNIDLLAGLSSHTDKQIGVIEKLVALGLDLNASVPQYVSIDENESNIQFGLYGMSVKENSRVPITLQAYYITTWYPSEENIRKFQAIIRFGGSLDLLNEKQKLRIKELTSTNPEFDYLYKLVSQ